MTTMSMRIIVVALALAPLGCSFYYSSESSGKTLTSPSRSSASSSPSEEKKDAYRDDVRDFTAAYAEREGDVDGFANGLSEVARRHGVTDWEADEATYAAIGAGLQRARVSDAAYARFTAALGVTGARAALMRNGRAS